MQIVFYNYGKACESEGIFVIPIGFEPMTHSLEGCCSIQLSYGTCKFWIIDLPDVWVYSLLLFNNSLLIYKKSRGGKIRTCDLLVPNQAR